MKHYKKTISTLLLTFFSLTLFGCSFTNSTSNDELPKSIIKEETLSQDFSNIILNWNNGEIRFLENDKNEITLVEKATNNFPQNSEFTYSSSGETLTINDADNKKINISVNVEYVLEVYLPKIEFDKIEVQGNSGDVIARKLLCKKLVINSNSADFDISGSFDNISMDLSAGDIRLDNLTMPKIIKINGNAVDVFLSIPDNDGFSLVSDQTTGDLESEFALSKGDQGLQIYGDGSNTISISLNAGDLSILKGKR